MSAAHKSENPAATGFYATNQNTHSQFNAKSCITEAQRERIIEALRLRPHTSHELRRIGIYQAPARIKELRDNLGFNIQTHRVNLVDADGYWHPRCALYILTELEATKP